jgi:hypothetical protein
MFGKETRANLLDLSVVQSGSIFNDSSVCVVNRLWDGERGTGVQFPARRKSFIILFHNAQTGSGSHPAHYLMGARLANLTTHFHGGTTLGMRYNITPATPPTPPKIVFNKAQEQRSFTYTSIDRSQNRYLRTFIVFCDECKLKINA